MTAHLGSADGDVLLGGIVHEPEAGLPDILSQLPVAPTPWAAEWLEVTAQPVSTVHDEGFFILAPQAHEMGYTAAASLVMEATNAVRDGQPDAAADLVDEVTAVVSRGASLFRLIATMRREAIWHGTSSRSPRLLQASAWGRIIPSSSGSAAQSYGIAPVPRRRRAPARPR